MQFLLFLLRYLRFFFTSGNEHSIHSPFVYSFYTQVVRSKKQFYIFSEIESLRKLLLNSKQIIKVQDFGTRGKNKPQQKKISSIARTSLKTPALSQILFRTAAYTHAENIVELGTSLGLTTAYLATANKKNRVITFEGCDEIGNIAKKNFKFLSIPNIECVKGNINETLGSTLQGIPDIHLVFFDANHRYEPTIKYFLSCLEKVSEKSVFIFDDIHWSGEMEKAWQEIIRHPKVMVSIDFFFLGIIFFHTSQPKQHFNLRI